MNIKIILLRLIGLTFIFSACITEIDLDTAGSDSFLVIQGKITTDKRAFEVTVRESARFSAGPEGAETPVSNALVSITDSEGNVETLTEVNPGVYQTRDDYRGVIDRTYELEITLADGATYRSLPETIFPVPKPDSAYIFFVDETNDVQVFINTPLLGEGQETYLTWNFESEWRMSEIGNIFNDICYVKEEIDFGNAPVFSSENITGDYLSDQHVFTRNVDQRFHDTYLFHIYQQSTTKQAYEFWNAVATELNRSGDIFETPPANIRGNIFNVDNPAETVLGLFYTTAVDTSYLFVRGSEVENPRTECRPFPRPPDYCGDCLLRDGARTTRPEYWNP